MPTAPLAEVSTDRSAKVRTTIAMLLKRAQSATNRRIAVEMASRWRDDHLSRAVDFILAVGCKVVPAEFVCIEKRELEAMQFYADAGIEAKRQQERKLVDDWQE